MLVLISAAMPPKSVPTFPSSGRLRRPPLRGNCGKPTFAGSIVAVALAKTYLQPTLLYL
jgi:hypothetical protein